jgi:amino acid adenylation domain-containing protein/FkbM family methyltransferase
MPTTDVSFIDRITNLSPAKRSLLELRLKEKITVPQGVETISPRSNRGPAPLSFAQQRLWFLNQLDPQSSAYNESRIVRLNGSLDVTALEKALNQIVERHEALRTTINSVDGTPLQIISNNRTVELPMFDLRPVPNEDHESETRRLIGEFIRRPFDLSRDLMLRCQLLRLGDQEHIFTLVKHHIASDGWSSGIFWRELSVLYDFFHTNGLSRLADLPIQYADYAIWQRDYLQGEILQRHLTYWKGQLADIPTLQLPTDRPRPAQQSFKGTSQSRVFSRELSDGLKEVGHAEGATLFMVLLAAFQTLLYRYTGQDDIAVGAAISGRTRAEVEGLIGFFANTLVFRTKLAGNLKFSEVLGRVRKVALEAYEHQDMPFERLVEELQPERDLSRSPLFQVAFGLQSRRESTLALTGLNVAPFETTSEAAKFDLYLSIADHGERLSSRLQYSTDLFDDTTITRMLGHLENLLAGIVAHPDKAIGRLPILDEVENHQILFEWNNTQRDYPKDKFVHELFEEQAKRNPDATAIVFEDQQLTYAQLNRRANQLARYLKKLGVGPDTPVALCVERSFEMILGILGILKAGGAYVPLDPEYPTDRLTFMLEDAGAPVLVTSGKWVGPLSIVSAQAITDPADQNSQYAGNSRAERRIRNLTLVRLDSESGAISQESDENPDSDCIGENLAYVIYTSGSAGQPKGVAVEHRNLMNYIYGIFDRADLRNCSSFATVSTIAADLGNTVVFAALVSGGSLHVISQSRALDPTGLAEYLSQNTIDCLKIVPTHLEVLQSTRLPEQVLPRKLLILGGEIVSPALIKRLRAQAPGLTLLNHYGPTECTIGAMTYQLQGSPDSLSMIPLGRPLANTQIYILDDYLQPVPIGVSGQVYIGGKGLARGYINRPELTAKHFISNPFINGERLYKTGDLGRYRTDGLVEFLGRKDDQVKIRGYRVEPGEVEAVLRQHPDVRDCVIVARNDAIESREVTGDLDPLKRRAAETHSNPKRLVAYVTPQPHAAATIDGKPRYPLPNGAAVAHLNKNETDYLYQEIFCRQAYLRHGIDINDGDCVFDVGANIGLFMLYVNHVYKNSSIYGFEPNPVVYERLRANASLYFPNARLFNIGLSNETKSSCFTFFRGFSLLSGFYPDPETEKRVVKTFMRNEQKNGASEMIELINQADDILDARFSSEAFTVQLNRLSSIIESEHIDSIDLLKINAEKSELDVLNGIGEKNWQKIKQVVLEVDLEEHLPVVISLLETHGFEVAVEQDGRLDGTPLCYVFAIKPALKSRTITESQERDESKPYFPNHFLNINELRDHLQKKLPSYMIPSAFVLLDSIPLTPNGKVDRNALPQPYSMTPVTKNASVVAPDFLEAKLTEIWETILAVKPVGVHDNFFELGGHSLLAVRLVGEIEKFLGTTLPITSIFQAPTIDQQAAILRADTWPKSQVSLWSTFPSHVVPFQPKGGKAPLFWMNWGPWDFRLSRYLGADQPVYGLQHLGQDGRPVRCTSIEKMAAFYVREMRKVQPNGPYFIGGFCIGGMIAFEMAHQLQSQGEVVALLVLLDPTKPRSVRVSPVSNIATGSFSPLMRIHNKIIRHLRELAPLAPQEKLSYALVRINDRIKGKKEKSRWILRKFLCETFGCPLPLDLRADYIVSIYGRAARAYEPKKYQGSAVIFKTQGRYRSRRLDWEPFVVGRLEVQELDSGHEDIFKEPFVQGFADKLKIQMSEARASVAPCFKASSMPSV